LLRSIVALAMPAALSNILRSYRAPTSAVLRTGYGRALPGRSLPDLPEALKPMIGHHWQRLVSQIAAPAGAGSSAGPRRQPPDRPRPGQRPATARQRIVAEIMAVGIVALPRGVWRSIGRCLGRPLPIVAVTRIAARSSG